MPQNPVTVWDADGQPCVMHSVDAKEAVTFGDYTYAAPGETDPQAMAAARSRFQTGAPTTHPEMLSDEEKDKQRAEANEKAALLSVIPEGAQVVVMAPTQQARSPEAPRRPQGTARTPASSESSTSSASTPAAPEQQRAARRESGSSSSS